jgi:predicted Zn-dependent protease
MEYMECLQCKPLAICLLLCNLGRVLVQLGRPAEAVPQFEQILEPDDEETPRYLYALGAAWARAGDRAQALRHLEDARRRASARGQADLVAAIERDLQRVQALPR